MSFENVNVDEYLSIIGLRAKGTRGRLSEDCKTAVEMAIEAGMTFANWDKEGRSIVREKPEPKVRKAKPGPVKAEVPVKSAVVRGANAMRVTDEDGQQTVLDFHYKCGKAIAYCRCRVVDAPAYYGEAKVELITI
jgi:hypothetical protein